MNSRFKPRQQELDFYQKMEVPVPEIAPEEIIRERMAFRNEWRLYRRNCDKTGRPIISAYHKDVPFPVYDNKEWWGGSWDALDYGRDYDESQSFFEQLKALQNVVPREGTSVQNSENCDFNSHTRESKNCYLCSLTYQVEDCYYSSWIVDDRDCADCRMLTGCELCYECINCVRCFDSVMLQECTDCSESAFSYQLQSCDHCIGCSNLTHKSYHVFNKPVSQEEYEATRQKILNGSYTTWKQGLIYFEKMWKQAESRFVHNLKSENVEGDILINCKNCFHTFEGWESEDCSYNVSCDHSKDIHHCYSAGWPACELVYRSSVTRGSTDIAFCYYTWSSNNLRYCDSCVSCADCFGCIGLHHKQYCILNQQYTKEDYFALREKIIEKMKKADEWGKFPVSLSTFDYNQTAAQDYYPLTKEEALARGFTWYDEDHKAQYSGPVYEIPDNIEDVGDEILEAILTCEATGKNYRIVKPELALYRKMHLPIPRICPEARNTRRQSRRNPYQLFDRTCDACSTSILSSFDPSRPERVLCEKCYLESVT